MNKQAKGKDILDFVSTLWIILSTGSLCFCIFNMKLSMIVLLGISCLYLKYSTKVKKSIIHTIIGILIFIATNAFINIRFFELTDDIIILLMRLFSLMLIFNGLSKERFMNNYCKIIFGLCCLSLVCFAVSECGFELPGEKTIWFKEKYYIYTLYHTVGRWFKFHRNAGIFWESPAFAIFINIAIAFLMLGNSQIDGKKRNRYFVIYSITVFTTLSTTAYLEYLMVILAVILNQRYANKNRFQERNSWQRYTMLLIIVIALIAVAVIELNFHIIETKLINGYGSVNERRNDTLAALELTMERPFTGFGMFNSYTMEALRVKKVTDNSNSFSTSFLYFGIPMGLIYMGWFSYRIRKLFDCSFLSGLVIIGAFIIFINSEQINVMTLFVAFLIPMTEATKHLGGPENNVKFVINKKE